MSVACADIVSHKDAVSVAANVAAKFTLLRRRGYANIVFIRLPPVVGEPTFT